jgi:hypothetical protein
LHSIARDHRLLLLGLLLDLLLLKATIIILDRRNNILSHILLRLRSELHWLLLLRKVLGTREGLRLSYFMERISKILRSL